MIHFLVPSDRHQGKDGIQGDIFRQRGQAATLIAIDSVEQDSTKIVYGLQRELMLLQNL